MDFSFGVITYNSADYVLETLESIKYQVINYGKNKNIELVISDDGSKDLTVELVNKWIAKNSIYFKNIEIITVPQNTGTVQNYKRIFHKLNSEHFHIIAGDDLYTYKSVFEFAKYLNKYDIVTTIPIGLNENRELFFNTNRVHRQIYRMRHKKFTCKQLSELEMFGSFIHSPSTLFRKELLTEDIEKFVDSFYLYEDDPKYYRMLKNTNRISFVISPIVIYRHLSKSVCHDNSNVGEIETKSFRADEINLCNYYISETHSSILKVYLRSKIKMIRHGRQFNIYRIIRGLDTIKIRILNYLRGDNKRIQNELEKFKMDVLKYYNEIHLIALRNTEEWMKGVR